MSPRTVPANFDVIDPTMALVLRQKTRAQRFEILDRFFRAARTLIEANIRGRNPQLNDAQVTVAVSKRITSEDSQWN